MRWLGFPTRTPDALKPETRRPHGRRGVSGVFRGYVIAVRRPKTAAGTPAGGAPNVSDPIAGVLCDVEITEPGYRAFLRNVPVATQSGGVWDHEHWTPRAADQNLGTGPLILEGGPQATPRDRTNGDLVLVAFLAGDMNRPVIVAQLPHPSTLHPVHGEDDYRYVRYVNGVSFGVKNDGEVRIDLSGATRNKTKSDGSEEAGTSKATIVVSGDTTITIEDGAVTIEGGTLTVKGTPASTTQALLQQALLGDLGTLFTEWYTLLSILAGIVGVTLPNSAIIVPLIAAGGPGSTGSSYKTSDTESS